MASQTLRRRPDPTRGIRRPWRLKLLCTRATESALLLRERRDGEPRATPAWVELDRRSARTLARAARLETAAVEAVYAALIGGAR